MNSTIRQRYDEYLEQLLAIEEVLRKEEKNVTFGTFLAYVRARVGDYCVDAYWQANYNTLKEKSFECIDRELPGMALHAVATDMAYKYG